MGRRPMQAGTQLLVAALLVLTFAPSAGAHATLLRTEPAQRAVTNETPARVVLTFDEPVEASVDALRVYDGSGRRVDRGGLLRPGSERIAMDLDDALRRGTYTVTWRVVSADSDPIRGAFVFHVQRPGAHPGGIAAEVLEDTPNSVTVAFDLARFFEYAFLLLAAGGALALALVLGSFPAPVRRRLYATISLLAALLMAVSLVELPLQGAAAGGVGLHDGFSRSVVDAVAETRFGEVALIRAGVAAALAATAFAVARRGGRALEGAVLALAGTALATPVAVSHASVSGRLATLADASHIAAAAAWLGGLAFLGAALMLAPAARWQLASIAVPRFSRVAVVAVAVVIAAGIVNGYLQVRTWSALGETTYGRLLLAKVALLTPLLGLGAFNNRFAVPRLRAAIASAVEHRRFLKAMSGELVLMTAIVAVTAVLVSAPPARTQHTQPRPHRGQLQVGPYVATIGLTPGRAGANTLRLDFAHSEVPVDVHVAATFPSKTIGPLRAMLRHTSHPTFVARDLHFPIAGVWSLRIEARRDRSELYTKTVTIRIAEAR